MELGFHLVGVAVIVIGATLGVGVFGPLAEKRAAALDSGDQVGAAGAQRRTIGFALLDTALIVVAIAAMVHKWQA